jgi:hypothetical protein
MSQSIDQVFIKQYEAEFHEAYQRKSSKYRGTVRTRSFVMGEDTNFPVIGKGSATQKGRNSAIPPMNVGHTRVPCPMNDWYAGDWNDRLDQLKTNIDERQALINAGVYALGRKTDEQIIDAIMTGTNTAGAITATAADPDAAMDSILRDVVGPLGGRDVPDDGERYAGLSPQVWAYAMTSSKFANADYVGNHPLSAWTEVRRWGGVIWFTHSGLPVTGTVRTMAVYHRTAIGHGINDDISTDITWHGDHAAWFINSMMSMGACLIDNDGVQKFTMDEAFA